MNICTFFGHRDAPQTVKPRLIAELRRIIEDDEVTSFYVGNNGNFDRYALSSLLTVKGMFPQIEISVVLAYLLESATKSMIPEGINTIFPEGLEVVPKRFAVERRNRFMAENCCTVIAYLTRSYGGAAKAVDYAKHRGVRIINLADYM